MPDLGPGELSLLFVTWNNPEQVIFTLNFGYFTCKVDVTVPALLHGCNFILLKQLTYSHLPSAFNWI